MFPLTQPSFFLSYSFPPSPFSLSLSSSFFLFLPLSFPSALLIVAWQRVTCADVLFSGHTVNLTLCALIWQYYSHVEGALVVDTEVRACPVRLPVGRLIDYCILHTHSTHSTLYHHALRARLCCPHARGRWVVDRWSASKRIARSPLLSPLSSLPASSPSLFLTPRFVSACLFSTSLTPGPTFWGTFFWGTSGEPSSGELSSGEPSSGAGGMGSL